MKTALRPGLIGLAIMAIAGCDTLTGQTPDGGTGSPDAGQVDCPGTFPLAQTTCEAAECSATSGTKTYAETSLDPAVSESWLIISMISSGLFDNQNLAATYGLSQGGGLSPALTSAQAKARRAALREAVKARHGPKAYAALYDPRLDQRVEAEHKLRAFATVDRVDPAGMKGTAIRGRTQELLPKGVHQQNQDCSAAAPACGETALCVIPQGQTDGTCEMSLMIRFSDFAGSFQEVAATVRRVGTQGAIVTDDADTVSEEDVNTLLQRFDERIAPLDHMFFGEPKNSNGQDRDQNGVTIIFLTSKTTGAPGSPVGFFLPDDLQDPATVAHSNGADLLYMAPPGGNITLDNLSGTIGHEYQHLINNYAKVQNRGSSPEARWLDEALSTFAEDALGYGSDAFTSVGRYLDGVNDTSLTGFGLTAQGEDQADSVERRGMGALFIRYIFEQRGGASYGSGPAEVSDNGGIAAVRGLVQSADTGLDAIASTGRSMDDWLRGFLTAVAIDGAGYPGVSCNTTFSFAAPEVDGYTGFQRGLNLREGFTNAAGTQVPLQGPAMIPYAAEETLIPANGAEMRSLDITQMSGLSLSGPVEEDFKFSLLPIPTKFSSP